MNGDAASDTFVPGLLQRRDTFQDPWWNQRNLLSLDGGGIRGYWSLLLLEKLMEAIGEEEFEQAMCAGEDVENLSSFKPEDLPPNFTQCPIRPGAQQSSMRFDPRRFLPCHYFDLMCGSSTGSLIAIMLCRFRMTVQDCLREYETMSHVIFGNPRWVSQRNIFVVPWPKYSAKAMERAFKQVTERRGERPHSVRDAAPPSKFKTKPGTCSMFATTFRRTESKEGSVKRLYLLRSYIHPERNTRRRPWNINFTSEGDMEIWRVARAATAAPFYFSEIKIKSNSKEKVYYSDGGFGQTNNPTFEGIRELETLHRRDEGDEVIFGAIGVIASIGTARADGRPGGKNIFKRTREAFSRATDPQHVADAVEYDNRQNCWRFNDEKGLDIDLDEWRPNKFTSDPGHKTKARMKAGFNEWLANWDNVRMLRACAKQLVVRRRARTNNASKWERFATVAEYRCPSSECHDITLKSRDDYAEHFESRHARHPHEQNFRTAEPTRWIYPSASSNRSSTGI